MQQIRQKFFCDPIYGKQLSMIADCSPDVFLYKVRLVLFSTKIEKM